MKRKSFTLIELIVTIAIIAILAAIIAPNVFNAIEKARIARTIANAKAIKTAINVLYADTGHWPGDDGVAANNGGLQARCPLGPASTLTTFPSSLSSNLFTNTNNWAGWDGPYLEQLNGKHQWGGILYLFRNSLIGAFSGQTGIYLNYHPLCFPGNLASTLGCEVRASSAQRIDNAIDDGNLAAGLFIQYIQLSNLQVNGWVYLWKIGPNPD